MKNNDVSVFGSVVFHVKHCLRRRKSYNVNAHSDGNDAGTKSFRFCGGRDPTVRNARLTVCDKRGHGVGFSPARSYYA